MKDTVILMKRWNVTEGNILKTRYWLR